jgi:rhomboid family GlyGly-CTERM serine protease
MLNAANPRLPVCRTSDLRLPWRSLSLAALALIAYIALGAAPEAWVFDRAAIDGGEIWRLVTAHWVHTDPWHALWNIAALLLLGLLFERRVQSLLLISLLVGTLAVDAWLWWGDASLAYYCGLSGILNSLLIVGLARFWRDYRHPLVLFTVVVVATKIAIEMIIGQGISTHTVWPSVPAAHAAGFLGGLALVLFLKVRSVSPLSASSNHPGSAARNCDRFFGATNPYSETSPRI